MISEFGNYNARIEQDTTAESADAVQDAVLTGDHDDSAVTEVTIGSLLDTPSVYSSFPRRRFRVRSSSVV